MKRKRRGVLYLRVVHSIGLISYNAQSFDFSLSAGLEVIISRISKNENRVRTRAYGYLQPPEFSKGKKREEKQNKKNNNNKP